MIAQGKYGKSARMKRLLPLGLLAALISPQAPAAVDIVVGNLDRAEASVAVAQPVTLILRSPFLGHVRLQGAPPPKDAAKPEMKVHVQTFFLDRPENDAAMTLSIDTLSPSVFEVQLSPLINSKPAVGRTNLLVELPEDLLAHALIVTKGDVWVGNLHKSQVPDRTVFLQPRGLMRIEGLNAPGGLFSMGGNLRESSFKVDPQTPHRIYSSAKSCPEGILIAGQQLPAKLERKLRNLFGTVK